jgi:predicted alpha/beta-fold hydrolase
MDLANFIETLSQQQKHEKGKIAAIGTSLGAAILW